MGRKVKLDIQADIACFNPPKKIIKEVKRLLTFENPKYKQVMERGGFIESDLDPILIYYAIDKHKGKKVLITPRGFFLKLYSLLQDYGCSIKIKDNTLRFKKIDFEFKGTLRKYQEKAVYDTTRRNTSVLEGQTGSGKTVMAINIIAQRKQPTLIIVHTKELLYQWQKRIKSFLGYDSGLVGDGKFEIKDITVGIINSISNNIDKLKNKFGHIICDECHRSPSKLWTNVLYELPASYLLGLSATPYRSDNLGPVIHIFLGPKLHAIKQKKVEKQGAVLKPSINRIYTNFMSSSTSYPSILKELTEDEDRNKILIKTIQKDLKKNNENILVVSDRVGHCVELKERLDKLGITSEILHGKIKANKRKEITDRLYKKEFQVLISTASLIGEGFDAPDLCALFLATPVSFKGKLIQLIGRILRPKEGKIARLYDFRDLRIPILKWSGYRRDRIYKSEWK